MEREGIGLLNLESAVRVEQEGSFLRDTLAGPDGSRRNATVYDIVDRAMEAALTAAIPLASRGLAVKQSGGPR